MEQNKKPILQILSTNDNPESCKISEDEFYNLHKETIYNARHSMPYKFHGNIDEQITHLRLPKDIYDKLKVEADKLSVPLSTYIRMILIQKL